MTMVELWAESRDLRLNTKKTKAGIHTGFSAKGGDGAGWGGQQL